MEPLVTVLMSIVFSGIVAAIISQIMNHRFARQRDLEREFREKEKRDQVYLTAKECSMLKLINEWCVHKISDSYFRFGNEDRKGDNARAIQSLIDKNYLDKINESDYRLNSKGFERVKELRS